MSINGSKRNYNLDLLKILLSLGIVGIHTLNATLHATNYFFSILTVVCIPLFFMLNGYFQFKKGEISFAYVLVKMRNILIVVFGWEFLHSIAYFLYYKQFRNFLLSGILDLVQKGLFYHFWFLGALLILHLLLPFFRNLEKNHRKVFKFVLIILGIICVFIDLAQFVLNRRFTLEIIQTYRIWQWLFYYLLGGYISTSNSLDSLSLSGYQRMFSIFCTVILLYCYHYFSGVFLNSIYMSEASYGSLIVIISCLCVFFYINSLTLCDKAQLLIKILSKTTLGVYIMHPFVLAVIVKFIPFVNQNFIGNLIFWIGTYGICVLITLVLYKVPFVNRLLEL